MTQGITIRYLVFTGHNVEPVEIAFSEGLNIVYGASNTGKSYIAKAITFMLGASSKLPKIEESSKYNAVWLGASLGDAGDVTIYRAMIGGNFKVYEGFIRSSPIDVSSGEALHATHDEKRTDTLSYRILKSIDLSRKAIVRNANAEKTQLSIRLLVPYVVVSEERIISENSPVLYSGQFAQAPFEKNLLRMLLTGTDDSAAVTIVSKKVRNVTKKAKVEIIDEMISQINDELGEDAAAQDDLANQIESIENETLSFHSNLIEAQNTLDTLGRDRRQLIETRRELLARAAELDVTLARFELLNDVYESDIARLESLEEGGYILKSMAISDCPVCGAPPGAQQHQNASEEIERAYKAAFAEREKILIEQRELRLTIASLVAETTGLRNRVPAIIQTTNEINERISILRPAETSLRSEYERLSADRAELARISGLYVRRDKLSLRRSQIRAISADAKNEPLDVGMDGPTAFAFSEVIRDVLKKWNFPEAEKAQFDRENNDIVIAGKLRAANGKGVRAVLHAAFDVAVLIFCKNNNLPHPGFVVLDTPLLTYREPLTSKYGELSADEEELKKTNLATYFYKHLASLEDIAQFIVLENADLPEDIEKLAFVSIFTGQLDIGRYGLFPPVRTDLA